MAYRGCLIFLGVVSLALLALGLFLLIPFPLAVFPALVKSKLHLSEASDGSFPTLTHYWSQLPANSYYDFYFFNMTNVDEVMYQNAMPSFVEVGPYSYKQWEFKEDIRFFDNDDKVYYKNNKSFAFDTATSCSTCTYNDMVTLPNAAYMAVASMIQNNINLPNIKFNAMVMDFLTLILGEAPVRTVPMAGVLFDSYNDPFIALVNSNLTKALTAMMGGKLLGMEVPPIKYMGYFPKYNHTADEDYVVHTGKSDVYKTAQIIKWAGNDSLAWWGDSYSASMEGCSDGAFQKPQLKKSDKVKEYISYACRAFHLEYTDDDNVGGVKAYIFKMQKDDYDSTLEKNKGFRYENKERKDYFPNWPCGSNFQPDPTQPRCPMVDCSLSQNWCDTCCNGSHYKDTVFLPPGIVPLRCLPGQKIRLPFAGFLSPPHFLQSPEAVVKSMRGINPVPELHEPAKFYINPLTGSTLKANFRMQLSIPIYNEKMFLLLNNIQSAFTPSFWVNIRIELKDYAHNYLKMNTTTIPHIALGVGVGLVVLPLIGILLVFLCRMRRSKGSSDQIEITKGEDWN